MMSRGMAGAQLCFNRSSPSCVSIAAQAPEGNVAMIEVAMGPYKVGILRNFEGETCHAGTISGISRVLGTTV